MHSSLNKRQIEIAGMCEALLDFVTHGAQQISLS